MSIDPPPSRVHPFDALATIACIYLALVTFGFAAFRYLAMMPAGAKRNQDITFFGSTNVVSLTGFEHVNAAVANYPTFGLIVIGTLATASALTSLIGGGYLLARVVGWRVSPTRLSVYAVAILLAPAMLGLMAGPFNGLSASLGLGVWARPLPTNFISTTVIGLGSVGLLGIVPFASLLRGNDATDRTGYIAWMLIGIALAVVMGAIALILCGTSVREAGVQSLGLRGFGGSAGPQLNASSSMPWLAMILALLGAAPASTAGGLSLLPIVIVIRGAIDLLRGREVDRVLGVALAWIGAFFAAFIASVIGLAALAPAVPGERMLLLVCAALGNVGVSHEAIGLTGPSLFLLSATMLVGRLLPFVMLAWMACVVEGEEHKLTASLQSP